MEHAPLAAPPEIGDCALLRALDVSANRFPSLPGQ